MPCASAPTAPCVEVCESPQTDRHARQVAPCSGTDHVHDALARIVHAELDDLELGAVLFQRLDLHPRHRVGDALLRSVVGTL